MASRFSDYKYHLQVEAEKLAEERGVDYFRLPLERQIELYSRAYDALTEKEASE